MTIRPAIALGIAVLLGFVLAARAMPDGPPPAPKAFLAGQAGPPPALVRRAVELTAGAPRVGYRVRFAGPRPAVRAQVDRQRRVIEVFVRPGDPVHRVAHDLAHELGHAFDDRRLSDAQRAAFLRRRGAAAVAWWPRGARSDLSSGAGDFAEVFARCHAPSPDFRSQVAPAPANACSVLPPEARPR